jgi:hypothetical protein
VTIVAPASQRTSSLVHHEFRVDDYPAVVCPLSPREPEDDQQGDDGDDTTRRRPYPRILDRLGEGIQPRESRLGRHIWGLLLSQSGGNGYGGVDGGTGGLGPDKELRQIPAAALCARLRMVEA